MSKIVYYFWLDHQAEEAARFYTSVFGDGRITSTLRYGEAGKEIHGQEPGTVMTVDFEIGGQAFTALNGGPLFKLNPSISFFVSCRTADEVNAVWNRLSDGGKVLMPLDKYFFSERYGWIEDRYGVSWQVTVAEGEPRQRFTPSLLFTGEKCGKAEEAIGFYTSVFRNASPGSVFRYGPNDSPNREGTIAYADFTLEGQSFAAMDSAQEHSFDFNEAISFLVQCRDQAEVDYYWNKLSAVPESEQCGWLKDRYGVTWQIVPAILQELLQDPDRDKAESVTNAFLQMKKLDITELLRAYKQPQRG